MLPACETVLSNRPESLSPAQKAKVLVAGVSIPRPANDRPPADLGLEFETHRIASTGGHTLEAWSMSLREKPLYSGWTFEVPYEVVTGHWTIEVFEDGRLLARQGFDVVGPDEGCPALQS